MEAASDLCFVEALVGETKHPPFHRSKRCSVDHEMCSLPWTRTGSLHNLLPRLGLASRLAQPRTSTHEPAGTNGHRALAAQIHVMFTGTRRRMHAAVVPSAEAIVTPARR